MSEPFFRRVLAGLALGILTGLFLGEAVWPIKMAGDVFIKLLQVTVLPYVIGSVIVGIGGRSTSDAASLARRGGLYLLLVWAAVLLWVVATALAYPPAASRTVFSGDPPPAARIDWVDLYIPSNVFHALAFNLLPAVVLFSLLAGIAISGMSAEAKRPLLEIIEAFNEAMRRVSRLIIRATPFGLFAMAAAAAGTLQVEDFVRLQIWFVVYIGSALLLALWVLPSLVALLTDVPRGRFIARLQAALLTAFAAGDYFVVLPMIAEANRQLLEEQGVAAHDADRTIGVAVPLLFNFPHAGKLLTLAFFPFGAWFAGIDLGWQAWGTLVTAGVLSLFGSINAAVPFLLDLLRLPADLFDLFTVSSVLNARFGALVAAVHMAALSMLVAASLLGRLRVDARRAARTAVMAVVVVLVFLGGTRLVFGRFLEAAPTGVAALEDFNLRNGQPPAVVRAAPTPSEPGLPETLLDRIGERRLLRVGFFDDGVPFAFFNPEGALVGFDVEMAHSLATALQVGLEFVAVGRADLAQALDSGRCDIVMSGVVVTMESAGDVAFSQGYQEDRIGFLVEDHRRHEFSRVAEIQERPLRLGVPSDRFKAVIQRRFPRATIEATGLRGVIDSGLGQLDAVVLPIHEGAYISRIQPGLTAVLPEDDRTQGVLAYAVPRGAESLRAFVNTWIEVTRASGGFSNARAYWVEGKAQVVRRPRWSIGSDLLGWW